MIDSKDLMVGNLFNRDKYGLCQYRRSHKLARFQMVDIYSFSSSGPIGGYEITIPIKDLEPISITEEWLLKLGFEIIQEGWYLYAVKDFLKFDISYITDGEIYFQCFEKTCGLQYIHQLQTLYFALTQKHLVIK